MIRHLPKAPAKRYWVTGNYIFDYRSNEYGMGALFQTMLIGNGKTHLPQIAFFKFQQEAMGKYTDQITVKFWENSIFMANNICFWFSAVYKGTWFGSFEIWTYCRHRKWFSSQFE